MANLDKMVMISPKVSHVDMFRVFSALDGLPTKERKALALAQAFLEATNATGLKRDVLLQIAGRVREDVRWESEQVQGRGAYDWAKGEL